LPIDMNISGFNVTGCEQVPLLVNSSSIVSNVDFYTVPAGKRLFIDTVSTNPMEWVTNFYLSINVAGNYYQLPIRGLSLVFYIAEAGETLAYSTTSADPTNIWVRGILFDDTNPLKTVKNLSLTAGDNTIYTTPASTSACILKLNPFYTTLSFNNQIIFIANFSGGTRQYLSHVVPNGSSPSNSNLIGETSIKHSSMYFIINSATLNQGDFINVNSSASGGTQYAWATVYEFPS